MNKTLAVLGMVAILFAAGLHAGAILGPGTIDAGRAHDGHMAPPTFSQSGPRVEVRAPQSAHSPARITPVKKGPGGTFSPTPEDWATYMHDSAHTCMIDGNAGSTLAQAWTYVTPGGGQTAFAGSPVESDSTVCFTSSDGYLYAINRNTGSPAWAPVLLGANAYREGTPVIWQDRVAVAMYTNSGANSTVFCRSLSDGSSLWATVIPTSPNLWDVYLTRPIALSVSGTPYVFLGCADFTATATRVLGLNLNTGAIAYDTTIASNIIIGGLVTDGTNLYVPLQTSGVVKLLPATPPHFTAVWTQSPAPTSVVNSTPVYYGGQVFAAEGSIAGPESLYALNATTGVRNWTRQVGDGSMGLDLGSPAIGGTNVYMYASNFSTSPYSTQLMAYHQSDGGDAWSTWYQTTDGLFDGGLAVTTGTNKRLYLTTGFGTSSYGHMLTVDAGSGSQLQDLPYATDYLYNSICRPYGGLYTLTYGSYASGTLVAYSVNDGQPASADVGATAVLAPVAIVNPGASITPRVRIMNFGTSPQSNIPVYCVIDSAGTTVYNHNNTYAGPLAAGDTASVTFSPQWTAGMGNFTYNLRMFTALSNDSVRANDTIHQATMVFYILDTLVAPYATTTPTIDGTLSPGEWSDALSLDVSDVLGMEGAPQLAGSSILYCKHDTNYVYYGVDMPPASARVDYDQVGCYVDENYNRAWATDSSEGNHWFAYLGGMDTTLYRSEPSYWIRWNGSPANGFCRSSLSSGHLQYEARVKKGANKWDYTINQYEDTVGFYMYSANIGGTNFLGHWPTTMPGSRWNDPTAYGTLILSTSISGVHESPAVRIPVSKLTLASNPATGSALVHYSVGRAGLVSLRLYDISGKLVSTLARSWMAAGNYQTTVDASNLAHGIYLLKYATDSYMTTAKLVIE